MSQGTNPALERLLGWLPAWLGFAMIIAAGVLAIVFGSLNASVGLIAIGAWALVSAVIAWAAGAKSSPRANPFKRSFGGVVTRVPQIPWLIIAGLLVVAVILAFVF